jgi:amino acid transporter
MVRYTDAEALASSTTPHVVGAEGIAGNFGLVWVSAMTLLAAASSIDTLIAAIPRMLYGLAREGMLPRFFAYVNPRFRTPWVAICAVTLLIAAPLALAITIDTIITLILIAAVTWLVSYIIAQVDVIVLRRKYPDARRPFKTPFYPVPQVLGIAACVYMIFSVHPDPATRNTIWLFAGLSALVILVYAVVWLKFVKKMTLFTPVPLDEELKIIREHSEPIESEPVDAGTTRGAKS